MTQERIPLETFIGDLDDATTAELRVAASKIDDLARAGSGLADVERRYLPAFIAAGALFLLGLYLFLNSGLVAGWILALCLMALPAVSIAYAWRVQPRTRADNAAQDLNKAHFLPRGGLYFPDGADGPCVVRVDWTPPPADLEPQSKYKDPRKRENHPGLRW